MFPSLIERSCWQTAHSINSVYTPLAYLDRAQKKPFDTGIIYYQRDGILRGAMMCNLWDKVDRARDSIRRGAGAAARLD
jgi:hypothetical protein